MSKNTPGPWIVASDKTSVLALTPVDMENQRPCPKVVDCASGYDAMDFEEAKANARLIAAAPEMLGVLEMALRYAREALPEQERRLFDDGVSGSVWMFTIRDTIAKATGGV